MVEQHPLPKSYKYELLYYILILSCHTINLHRIKYVCCTLHKWINDVFELHSVFLTSKLQFTSSGNQGWATSVCQQPLLAFSMIKVYTQQHPLLQVPTLCPSHSMSRRTKASKRRTYRGERTREGEKSKRPCCGGQVWWVLQISNGWTKRKGRLNTAKIETERTWGECLRDRVGWRGGIR